VRTTLNQHFKVIAHRGASGYLPEHTLEAATLAHAMAADYIELDVVVTRDNVPVVLHDLYLDSVTDVTAQFPGRSRADGLHYAVDFTWQELGTLRVHERTQAQGQEAFPARFPASQALFRIPSLEQMLQLIQGLNATRLCSTGVYIEPKSPDFHKAEGKDVLALTLKALSTHGFNAAAENVYLQSFDAATLKRAKNELAVDIPLVQLIGDNRWGESLTDFDRLRTPKGMAETAEYAVGIGPWLPQLMASMPDGRPKSAELVAMAHDQGLLVHAYTLRADQLPKPFTSLEQAVNWLSVMEKLDGVFTDHPDLVLKCLL